MGSSDLDRCYCSVTRNTEPKYTSKPEYTRILDSTPDEKNNTRSIETLNGSIYSGEPQGTVSPRSNNIVTSSKLF